MPTDLGISEVIRRHVADGAVRNADLYKQAFTPRWLDRSACYERLEFLGDSILSAVVSSYLFERYPDENEGFLTSVRARLVSGATLARLTARFTPFATFVLEIAVALRGEEQRSALIASCSDPKVLEDVFEAFIGALFLDCGFEVARDWLVGFMEEHVDFAEMVATNRNPKSELNALCKGKFGYVPTTTTAVKRGGGYASTVRDIYDVIIGSGQGKNKIEAELRAASAALRTIGVVSSAR